jgi:hypothetical protein
VVQTLPGIFMVFINEDADNVTVGQSFCISYGQHIEGSAYLKVYSTVKRNATNLTENI